MRDTTGFSYKRSLTPEETSAKVGLPSFRRNELKVARHFSAGLSPQDGKSPVGTTEISSGNAFMRPYGTRRFFFAETRH